jgi:hypothetical protein
MGLKTIDVVINGLTKTYILKGIQLDLTMSDSILLIFAETDRTSEYAVKVPLEGLLQDSQLDLIYQALQDEVGAI